MRRRAHAAGRQAARRHGPRRRAGALPPLPGPAGDGHGPRARAASGRRTPCTRSTATSCAAASSTSFVAANAERAGATLLRATRRSHRSSSGASCAAPTVQRADGGDASTIRGRVHGRRRRRQQPLRPGARHVPHPRVAVRHGDPHVLASRPQHAEPWIESALDVKDRNGNPMPGLRLDLPGRRRHGEHRRRAAVDVPRLQERQHDPPARRVRPPDRRPLGDRRRRPRRAGRRAGASRWAARSGPKAGPTLPRRRRRRRQRQPVQRRGHRLRLRDGADGRRRAPRGARRRRRRPRCSATRSCSTTSTASTSRSPACSPASSAARR